MRAVDGPKLCLADLILDSPSKELLLDQPFAGLVQPRAAERHALEPLRGQQLQAVAHCRRRAVREIDEAGRRRKAIVGTRRLIVDIRLEGSPYHECQAQPLITYLNIV